MIDARVNHDPDPAVVRDLVAQTGLSVRECAVRLGVKRNSLNRWMGKATNPGPIPYCNLIVLRMMARASRRP